MLLQKFNGDIHTKEALLEFIHDHIDDEALDKMYKGEDVSHIKDARSLIDSAFDELQELYGIKQKVHEQKNEAK